MAVLAEGISVIIKLQAIAGRFPGGLARFREMVPNRTFCMDEHLARVGFMSPGDVTDFIGQLEACGLVFLDNERPVDIAVSDQDRGLTTPCDWVRFGFLDNAD